MVLAVLALDRQWAEMDRPKPFLLDRAKGPVTAHRDSRPAMQANRVNMGLVLEFSDGQVQELEPRPGAHSMLTISRGFVKAEDGSTLATLMAATGRWRDDLRRDHDGLLVSASEGGRIEIVFRRPDGSRWRYGTGGAIAIAARSLSVDGAEPLATQETRLEEWSFGPSATRFEAVELAFKGPPKPKVRLRLV